MKHTSILFYILSLALITSCSSKKKIDLESGKDPIVSVYDKTLYRSELENTTDGLNSIDSTKSANAYIQMWIKDELIYKKAKQNVSDQERINELVENYRQSLTIFTYLEELLRKELSNKLSETELKKYYDSHSDKFKLETNLIKGLFLKIPQSAPDLNNLRQWYKSNSNTAKENIQKASIQNSVIFEYFYDRWVSIDDITANIPVPFTDKNQFIKTNKNFETKDSTFIYLLHIEEYALIGSQAPYEYIKPQITDILLNKHREDFLKQFETDLYTKALKNKEIEYHIKWKSDK